MNETTDPTPNWTRQLAQVRSRALRLGLRRPERQSPLSDVLEDALTAWGSLLREFAGAQLECERLRGEVEKQADAWQQLFEVMPGACVLTDVHGVIRDANRAAAGLFNVSAKHLKERQLFLFTENRDAFGNLLRHLAEQEPLRRASLRIRPRERRPIQVDVVVAAFPLNQPVWLWFFVPNVQAVASDDALQQSA